MSGRPATSGAGCLTDDRLSLVLVAILLESAAGVTSVAEIETALDIDHKGPMSEISRFVASALRATIATIPTALASSWIELSEVCASHSLKVCLQVSKRMSTEPVAPWRFFSTFTLIARSLFFERTSSRVLEMSITVSARYSRDPVPFAA